MAESKARGVCHAQAMGLEDYLEVVWPRANVYLGSGPDDEKFLTRPYGRVDRPKLKRMLLQRCIDSGVIFHIDKVRLIYSHQKPILLLNAGWRRSFGGVCLRVWFLVASFVRPSR
jgi:Lycopene cyclase protein